MQAAGSIKSKQFDNKGGAGGTIGLAQFVNSSKGDGSALFVWALVMVGATATNQSPVTLANVTPIARLTAEAEAIIVPAGSPFKSMKDVVAAAQGQPGCRQLLGRLRRRHRPHPRRADRQDAGIDPAKVNYVPFTSGAEARPRCWAGTSRRHLGLRRVRAAHQVRPGARAGVSGADKLGRHPIAEGTGHQRRARELARRVRRAGDHAGADEGIDRRASRPVTKHAKWQETLQKLDWTPYWLAGDAFKTFVDSEQKRIAGVLDSLNLTKK